MNTSSVHDGTRECGNMQGSRLESRYVARQMPRGTVKWFNDAKGYGFISRPEGGEVFVHYASIVSGGFRTLSQGQLVDYDEIEGAKGLHATQISTVATLR